MGIERVAGARGASFSKAVVVSGAGRTVYVSGHLAPGRSMAEQTNGCFDQIEAALRTVGGSLDKQMFGPSILDNTPRRSVYLPSGEAAGSPLRI